MKSIEYLLTETSQGKRVMIFKTPDEFIFCYSKAAALSKLFFLDDNFFLVKDECIKIQNLIEASDLPDELTTDDHLLIIREQQLELLHAMARLSRMTLEFKKEMVKSLDLIASYIKKQAGDDEEPGNKSGAKPGKDPGWKQ